MGKTKLAFKSGERFGRLQVISETDKPAGGRGTYWLCRCDCGTKIVARGLNLNSENTRSCGCLMMETSSRNGVRNKKHGQSTDGMTPTYRSWMSMLARCTNERHTYYYLYGGAGIVVCDRWRSFEAFFADMGERPPGTSLDRFPDQRGNYEPGNVRWATRMQQTRNSRTAILTVDLVQEIHGRSEHGEGTASISERMGVTQATINSVLSGRRWKDCMHGYPPEHAL